MDFYQAIERRRTVRDFKPDPVDAEVIKRILSAGLKAPTNDHMRSWEFVVVTDKAVAAQILKKIPKKVSDKRLDFIMQSWKMSDTVQQRMYIDAIPKQYQMLYNAGCLLLPFYKQKSALLKPKALSSLNAFASIWCCIENILLAATTEGIGCALRIPLGSEAEHIREIVHHPAEYVLPCCIGIGYPAEDAAKPEQKEVSVEEKMHFNQW